MNNGFSRDWWGDSVARPYLRLTLAMIMAPLIMAALATAAGFVIAGMTMSDGAEVRGQTREIALIAVSALTAFGFSFALAAVLILWLRRMRAILAFALAGAAAGAAFIAFSAWAFEGAQATPAAILVMTAIGAMTLLLIRAIAGVRARPDSRPQ